MRTLVLLLAGCSTGAPLDTEPVEGPPERPIVVVFTTDTLGAAAAESTGWCDDLSALAGRFELDVACPDGAVAPSSWTGESHTRMLFPQHLAGNLRANEHPSCGAIPALALVAQATDGSYVWGSDNEVLGGWTGATCIDERPSWFQRTTSAYVELDDGIGLVDRPESTRAVHFAVDDIVTAIAADEPVVAFLDAFEVGGHFPRCWFEPETPGCDGLWSYAVERGLIASDANRPQTWLTKAFQQALLNEMRDDPASEARLRPLLWGSMEDKILEFRDEMVNGRVERILRAANDADRLSDVTIVLLGDHGETPGVLDLDGELSCSHGGLPNEWTANVPVAVIPASRAEAWAADDRIGDAERPWTTVGLIYALVEPYSPLDDLPRLDPPGTVSSWTCRGNDPGEPSTSSGVHIEGAASARCLDGICEARTWGVPEGWSGEGVVLADPPAALLPWLTAGPENPFEDACSGL